MDNVKGDGDIDTDKVGRALMTYRNTPNKDLGLSPAQLLFGRQLKDHLPGSRGGYTRRREWIMQQKDRERALAHKYGQIEEKLRKGTRDLKELVVGDSVQVQNQHGNEPLRWDRSGTVIERLEHGQYTVRMDGTGRITLRNRKYLRRITPAFRNYVRMDEIPQEQEIGNDTEKERRSSRNRYKYRDTKGDLEGEEGDSWL